MARIRSIKPSVTKSESLGQVSREARLLFILMWTAADDYGRLRGTPQVIAGELYPYDADALALIPGWLDELAKTEHVVLYKVGRYTYIEIVNWAKHQRIDNAGKSDIPPPSAATRGEPPNSSANRRDSPLLSRIGEEGKGEERIEGPTSKKPTRRPHRPTRKGSHLATDWMPSPEDREYARSQGFDDSDIEREATAFWAHFVEGPGRGKTWINWSRAWEGWIRRAVAFGHRLGGNGAAASGRATTSFVGALVDSARRMEQTGTVGARSDPEAPHGRTETGPDPGGGGAGDHPSLPSAVSPKARGP